MEGRCTVETWAELGISSSPTCLVNFGTDVFLCTGSDEVYAFNTQQRKLTAVLQFPGPVNDLVESYDKQVLFVPCRSGVYSLNLQFLLSRFQSSQASSCPVELKIPSEFLVVREERVLSLIHVGSILLILSQTDTSWLFSLYKTTKQTPTSKYEILSSISLPHVAQEDNELKGYVTRRPVLVCVYSDNTRPPYLSSTSSKEAKTLNQFHLEPVLFRNLFGIDSALVKSPVILCGLSDGRLCFLPLLLPGLQLRVLHHLEQPVVFVGASVVMKTSPAHAQCLVVVGELGRVVVIKREKSVAEGKYNTVSITEGCLPGPVVCGCVDKHNLYFSTGSDLFLLELSDGSQGSESQHRNEETCGALKSHTSLNVCRVMSLAEPVCGIAGEVELLGVSVRGQLQRITLPARTEVGCVVNDLLPAIGDVCERASALETSIKSKKQILVHLNHVLNIGILLIANQNSENNLPEEEKPIRCHAILNWNRLLQKESLNLTCVLNNSSPYILQQGWTLNLDVCPLSTSVSTGGESHSTTFSLPFCNLHPGQTIKVSLPLAIAEDKSFPVMVNCSLIFSLAGLLGEEQLLSSCISLPLNTLLVDWLHVLQVDCPTASHRTTISQYSSGTKDILKTFLSSQHNRCSGRGPEEVEGVLKQKEEQYSANVHVSLNLLRDTQVLKSSHIDLSHSISLLDWLLFEEHGGVKMGHQWDKTTYSSAVVRAQASNGDKIKLIARKVNVGKECLEREESPSILEVQVEGKSIEAVRGLHHAVLNRLLTLLQKASRTSASARGVYRLGLRSALHQAEHVLKQIQQSRILKAESFSASPRQMTRSVTYQELKGNCLL
ncbi:Fanconi anemia core complex-associated protein 100 [Betta splendens]|uniref:Fanconi anemia core complex-associated protein 100 n=1 Tax=Betta splendens TaxID=158456 RepID=A0A6P7L9P9_BETSP|nr:Fanconi anemia core complex-associated protein 100 [Betta splendens]